MRIEFPDLKDKEENTLFIIGNGFDIHHSIKSTYEDFRCWLMMFGHKDFVQSMEHIFGDLPTFSQKYDTPLYLWKDFEGVLAAYDSHDFYQRLHTPTYEQYEVEKWHLMVEEEMGKTVAMIRPLMKLWAKQIDIKKVRAEMELCKKCRYLTFNYTKVLEDVYRIPSENICHVHGSVDDEELIVGHNKTKKPDSHYAATDEEEITERRYIEEMNKLGKDFDGQIKKNENFFGALTDVSRVVVLGHSMGEIDLPYFRKVRDRVCQGTHWHFSKHSERDENYIQEFLYFSQKGEHRICRENRWIFNF